MADAGLPTQPWPSTNSPLLPIADRLRTLASGPSICLPHLLHLRPALQCQNPGKQGHSPRRGPSPATKEFSEPCPSAQLSAFSNAHSTGSSLPPAPTPPHPTPASASIFLASSHFSSGLVGGFFRVSWPLSLPPLISVMYAHTPPHISLLAHFFGALHTQLLILPLASWASALSFHWWAWTTLCHGLAYSPQGGDRRGDDVWLQPGGLLAAWMQDSSLPPPLHLFPHQSPLVMPPSQ